MGRARARGETNENLAVFDFPLQKNTTNSGGAQARPRRGLGFRCAGFSPEMRSPPADEWVGRLFRTALHGSVQRSHPIGSDAGAEAQVTSIGGRYARIRREALSDGLGKWKSDFSPGGPHLTT